MPFALVAFVDAGAAAGVLEGTRVPRTCSSQPFAPHGPAHVRRPGALTASVTWPALHVPRVRT